MYSFLYFFFFKQKTAYEMRISDWSSDVCSSDLQGGLGLPDREYYLSPQFQKQRDAYRAYIVRTLTLIGNANPETAADTIMGFEKIGRASCRERVCQYV